MVSWGNGCGGLGGAAGRGLPLTCGVDPLGSHDSPVGHAGWTGFSRFSRLDFKTGLLDFKTGLLDFKTGLFGFSGLPGQFLEQFLV